MEGHSKNELNTINDRLDVGDTWGKHIECDLELCRIYLKKF
jgi:hypothetical protein